MGVVDNVLYSSNVFHSEQYNTVSCMYYYSEALMYPTCIFNNLKPSVMTMLILFLTSFHI